MPPSVMPQESGARGPLIMAVDDSEIALEMVLAILAEFGLTNVVTFSNPSTALSELRNGEIQPDLILMDVMMPEINGIDACAEIRGSLNNDDVPIIMLTSLENMGTLSRAFLAGANDYVNKPFEPIELEARIRNGLRLGSELRRRKSSEARLLAELRSRPTEVKLDRDPVPDLILSRSMFETAIRSLAPISVERICLIVTALQKASQSDIREDPPEPDGLARVLGQVLLPANSLLTQIETNLYCIVAMDLSEDSSRQIERSLALAVTSAGFRAPLDLTRGRLVLRTTAKRPSENYPLSAALADGIREVRLGGIKK